MLVDGGGCGGDAGHLLLEGVAVEKEVGVVMIQLGDFVGCRLQSVPQRPNFGDQDGFDLGKFNRLPLEVWWRWW